MVENSSAQAAQGGTLCLVARSRLFGWLFGGMGLMLFGLSGGLGLLVADQLERFEFEQVEGNLRFQAEQVAKELHDLPPGGSLQVAQTIVQRFENTPLRLTFLDGEGHVLADSAVNPPPNENHGNRPEIVAARRDGTASFIHASTTIAGHPMIYVAHRVESSPIAFIRFARSLESIEEGMRSLRRVVWAGAGGGTLAALLLAFWLARGVVLPLQQLTRGAEAIAAGAFGHHIALKQRNEIGTLARAFNDMSAQLAQQFAQVERDRQTLRAVLSGMVEGVLALDQEQRLLFVNERAGQLLGFAAATAVGQKIADVVFHPAVRALARKALAASESEQIDFVWTTPSERRLLVHLGPLSNAPSGGAVLVLHDTTELHRLERLRQDFVANVSHELKTPLAVIKACVETLIDGAVNDLSHRDTFLRHIDEQADHLHLLILDLLSLARIESGREVFQMEAVSLTEAIAACLERHQMRAAARNQVLVARGTGDENTAAWADAEAVSIILDNLVDNALKYTPAGGRIEVRCSTEAEQVLLQVADSGIGIPGPDLQRIFERFYRVDKARSRQLGGTGLGLSIVKHLVQALHGGVQAESTLGGGSTFSVRLPRASLVGDAVQRTEPAQRGAC